jgi:hypothetical protein
MKHKIQGYWALCDQAVVAALTYYWKDVTCEKCLKLRKIRVKKSNREWGGKK